MSIDVQSLKDNKEKILSFLKLNGPSLTIKIAKAIEISPLFTSAFLAELHKEEKLKMSNLRVGSSPIYFLLGQEQMLEKYSEHLNQREKEALSLLKQSKILEDQVLPPPMRVAIRSIRDFAIPVRARINEQTRLFWRYFSLKDEEVKPLLEKKIYPAQKQAFSEPKEEIQKEIISSKSSKQIPKKEITIPIQLKEKPKKTKEYEFPNSVSSYLEGKEIEILEKISEKKKELTAKIRIDTLFGKQTYYLIAKDKKKVTETDLALALQKAQEERMPALVVSSGELDKKAQSYIKEYQNLIKYEKTKF